MTNKEKYVLEHYEITKEGKIFSCLNSNNNYQRRELSYRVDKDGYFDVTLVCGGNRERQPFRVHRLVALKFLSETKGLPIVNHLDLNKQNNHVDNLRWSDASINTQHGYDNCAYKHVKKVKVTEPNGDTCVFPSASHASRYYYYVNSSTVNQILSGLKTNPILKGKRKGLFFEYTNEGVTTIERNPSTVTGV